MPDLNTSETRTNYPHFLPIPTRWMDVDTYHHVNNVVYYSFFDTVINEYLISSAGMDTVQSDVIGFAVETHCQFLKPIVFPETVSAGLRVAKIGNSSVRYEIGIFKQGDETPAAVGYFVHVFVNRQSQRPTPLPQNYRTALEKLLIG